LRQEQRAAVGPLGQLAWLVAFNEALLDGLPLDRVGAAQQMLIQRATAGNRALADGRERWVAAVRGWWEAWQAEAAQAPPSPAAAPPPGVPPAAQRDAPGPEGP
jgi:hypothetical protein